MDWFYADDSDQQHTVSEDGLAELVASGTIRPTTLVWNESMTDWRPAVQARPDLFNRPGQPPVLSTSQIVVATSSAGMGAPQSSPADSLAICSLVFSILGILCIGPLMSIPAIICGHIARKRARDETLPSSNGGLALAGLVVGYIGLALWVIFFVVYAIIMIGAVAAAGLDA